MSTHNFSYNFLTRIKYVFYTVATVAHKWLVALDVSSEEGAPVPPNHCHFCLRPKLPAALRPNFPAGAMAPSSDRVRTTRPQNVSTFPPPPSPHFSQPPRVFQPIQSSASAAKAQSSLSQTVLHRLG